MKKILFSILLLYLLVSTPALALVQSEHFNGDWDGDINTYTEGSLNPFVSGGLTHHTYMPTSGWQASGAAKFVPPLLGEDSYYAGFGNDGPFNSRKINLRALVMFGSQWDAMSQIKWWAIYDHDVVDRYILWVTRHHENGDSFEITREVDESSDAFDYSGFEWNTRRNEWLCIEYELDMDSGYARAFMTTQDGVWNQTEIARLAIIDTMKAEGNYWVNLDGPYFQQSALHASNDPEEWEMFDEWVLRTDLATGVRIGPPSGFLSNNTPITSKGWKIVGGGLK